MQQIRWLFLSAITIFLISCGDGDSGARTPTKDMVKISPANGSDIKILRWGPSSTTAGGMFNVQPSGLSAIWFEFSGEVLPESMELWFGDKKLDKFVIQSNKGGSASVPNEFFSKPGRLPVYLVHAPSKKRFDIGVFTVNPRAADVPSIVMERWGPSSTTAGEMFNVQPSGLSAIWFGFSGDVHPPSMEVWFGDRKLDKFYVANNGGAALVPNELISKPGRFQVYLVHAPSKKRFDIGEFVVNSVK